MYSLKLGRQEIRWRKRKKILKVIALVGITVHVYKDCNKSVVVDVYCMWATILRR